METQNEAVSLAVLWKDSRTYQGNLGEFEGVKNSMVRYFAGSSGWLDTYKKSMKWKVWEFYARGMAEFPRILFGRERGNLTYARLGLIKWLMYSPRKTLRGKLPVRYQGLTLRFAVNVDVLFLNRYLY